MAQAKDPETAFFKKLDGFQQCEVTELKAGTHVFAVYGQFSWFIIWLQIHLSSPFYICLDSVFDSTWWSSDDIFLCSGDNFFKNVSYTIQVLCAAAFTQEKEDLRSVEAQILTKRAELAKFETEYREVLVQFTDMTSRYAQEMQSVSLLFMKVYKFQTTIHRKRREDVSWLSKLDQILCVSFWNG